MNIGTIYSPSFGDVSVGTIGDTLCCVEFGPDSPIRQKCFKSRIAISATRPSDIILGKVLLALEQGRDYEDPIAFFGTRFQKDVWYTLKKVPYGQTISYKEVAEHIGNRKAIRAVASACAANPIAVIVPCHRVVRADGADSGYRWGLELKQKLLLKEYYATHPMMVVLS